MQKVLGKLFDMILTNDENEDRAAFYYRAI